MINQTSKLALLTFVVLVALASPTNAQAFYYNEFNDSSTTQNLSYLIQDTNFVGIRLPKSASYASSMGAVMNITGDWNETTGILRETNDISGETTSPQGLASNDTFYFVLAYQPNEEIHYYNKDGTYAGITCTLNVVHDLPGGLVFNGTNFFAMDQQNGRLEWYKEDCTYLGTKFTFPAGYNPHGITFNGTNFFAIEDGNLTMWSESGVFLYGVDLGNIGYEDGIYYDGNYMYVLAEIGGVDWIERFWLNGTSTGWTFNLSCASPNGLDYNGTHFATVCDTDDTYMVYEEVDLYPENIVIDLDNDGSIEFSMGGPLNDTNSPVTVNLNNNSALQDFLFDCVYDDDGFCNVTINITANEGIIIIDSLNVSYDLDDIISQCSPTENVTTINFTLYEEENPTTTIISDLDIAFTEIVVGPDLVTNASFNLTGSSNYSLCISPSWANYNVTATLTYDATDYAFRTYYLVDNEISSDPQTIDLYLINDSSGTLVTFSLVDATNEPVENAYLHILRHYIGENEFRTVAITRSDFDGKGVTYLILNDVFYRFTIIQDGEILDDIDPTLITASTLNIQLSPGDLGDLYNVFQNVQSVCSYNNVTETLSCTMTDASGTSQTACLNVTEILNLGEIETCNTCGSGATIVTSCNVGNITDRLFYYSFALQGSLLPLEAGYLQGSQPVNEFGTVGLLAAFFLILFMGLAARGPSMVIITTVAGFSLMTVLAFITVAWSAVIGIAVAGGIIIYVVKK